MTSTYYWLLLAELLEKQQLKSRVMLTAPDSCHCNLMSTESNSCVTDQDKRKENIAHSEHEIS